MDAEFADLVPLFVSEARGRIERLAQLAARVESDADALPEVRRELHTLKGAGRMLRLAPLAEVCHAAEGAMLGARPGQASLLTRVVDGLAAMVDEVARGSPPSPAADLLAALAFPAAATIAAPASAPAAPATSASDELRIDTAAMDALTERATRLRILGLAAGAFPVRLFELARLTEQAIHDPSPDQALAVLAASLRRIALELETGQQRLRRTADAHLEKLLALQLQPLRGFFLSLSRHARELARTLGKEVDVATDGDETKVDRRIVIALEEALVHVVRNAVDHGIEAPAVRQASGKPRSGSIRLAAAAAGSRVRITIVDDGAGIDPVRVRAAALEAGLIDEAGARALGEEETLRLLFAAGLSTRGEVSEVSGRGVGMDAVAAAVERVGGEVRIASEPGHGTTVTLEVPAAMRGEVVLIVRAGGLSLALPASLVRAVTRIDEGDVIERNGRTVAGLGDRLVPFLSLARAFGESAAAGGLLLEGVVGGQAVAVAVDAIEGEQEVLVRPLARAAKATPLIEGVALLASGVPVAVLSPSALAQRDMVRPAALAQAHGRARKLRVLLVDDSLVTREMERRLLEDAGFDVRAASDASEALTHLSESTFECLVTDVEMPGMDGLELTRRLRTIPHLAQLPVVVVSTRDRPEDRLRGLEAGADAYLAKQGLDASELITLIRKLGGR
ncbi:MAG: hybrid sensor histidine kinase/response regulator [Acidobacteriota bacterium]